MAWTKKIAAMWIVSFVACLLIAGSAFSAGLKVVPSAPRVQPGELFYFDLVAEGIPATGLSGAQFRVKVTAPGVTLTNVGDVSQTGDSQVALAAPLLISPPTAHHSGVGDLLWNSKGPNGLLVMENDSFVNGSALFTLAHTNGATPVAGTGVIARFAGKAGSAVTADRIDITLSDVMLLDNGPAYPLDYVTNASIQLACKSAVPTLSGLTLAQAQTALTAVNLKVGTLYEINNDGSKPLNQVLEQSVAAGSELACQSTVNLAINTAPAEVTQPGAADKLHDDTGTVVLTWIPSISPDTAGYRIYANATMLNQVASATATTAEVSGLGNGVATVLTVKAYDTFGNESSGASVQATAIDDVAPVITVAGIVEGSNYNRSVSPTVTIAETNPKTSSITLDGVAYSSGNSITAAGSHTLLVTAEDLSGNTATKSVSFVIDTAPPTLTVTPVTAPVTQPSATLTGTIEAGLSISISALNSATVGTVTYPGAGTWSCPVSGLVAGPNTITITATDLAGNTSTVSVVVTYTSGPVAAVTPASISADQTTPVRLAVSNLATPGSELLVEQFVDANKNGLVDAGDYVIRSFKITDGIASIDSGLSGDEDGLIDGMTSTNLNTYLTSDLHHVPANYLIRVTQGSLATVTPFLVTSVNRSQSVSGMVTNGASPLAGALVRLSDSVGRHISFAVADETGRYTLQVSNPGTYLVTPLVYGYASSVPQSISLASGQVLVDQNLAVIPGSFHLAGTVKDETSSTGIQGVWVWAKGQNTSAVALTAADGSYDLSLPAGQYSLSVSSDPSEATPFAKGYLVNVAQSLAVNLAADSTGNDLLLSKGSSFVSGRVLDQFGNGVAGIPVQGSLAVAPGSSETIVNRVSTSDGSYQLPLVSGDQWGIALNPTYAGLNNLISSSIRNYSTSGSNSTGMNIVTHPITAWGQGVVKDSVNTLLGGVKLVLRNADSSIIASTVTAADGSYRIGAYGGNWFVKALTEEKGLHPVAEQSVVLADSQVTTLDFVVDVTPPAFAINPVTTPTTSSTQTITGTIEAGATVLVSVNTSAVAGTVTYPTTTSWSCTITGLLEGANTITATATDISGNQTSATATITYAKAAGPDLIVTAVSVPTTLNSGETVSVQVTVKNQGTVKAGKFFIGLYLSTDGTITTGDTFLGHEYLTTLAAGAEESYTTSITLPKKTNGTYYVGAIVDTKGKITESDETNNTFAVGPITVGNGPDLVVTGLGVPSSLASGQTVSVPVSVRNKGTGAAGKFYIGLYLSTDSTITTGDTFLSHEYISSLAVGADESYTTSITLPSNISGTYYIGAIVDSKGAIAESDESNNSFAAGPVSVAYGPDLVVAALGAPVTATAGKKVTIPVTIKNQGVGAAGKFYIYLYLSTVNALNADAVFLGDEYLSTLAAGAEESYTTSVTLPSNISGTYYIGAVVDSKAKIGESDETNNTLMASPTVVTK